MLIGIPKEIKNGENRVALTPRGARQLVASGHTILIETQAGICSGYTDTHYRKSGAKITSSKRDLFRRAELIVKVKEPEPEEYFLLQDNQILFTFLHLADHRALTKTLLKKNITAFGYELVETPEGHLPLLSSMSEIAGKLSVIIGANYLRRDWGGRGILLSEIEEKPEGHITILGAGTVGLSALKIAHGLGCHVNIIDIDVKKLRKIHLHYRKQVHTFLSRPSTIKRLLPETNLLIGAVHIKGRKTERLVTKRMVQMMRPGSVIVDVAIDQGGCVASSRVTTIQDPVFLYHGVTHFCVPNIPSLVCLTATKALTDQTLPYIQKIARWGWPGVIEHEKNLLKGLYTADGKILHPGLRLDKGKRKREMKMD
ncbi:MAG: alanine dehydrogenase [Deltaproteobacteria bacterium RIFCSPLOWO2_12_FULL_50_11]|nr:MAG: alanine dehydrogenase [Deltaproteobacteria bacterium GWA2_50_8]OGQ69083.1 MAG: alanine dehydrogenase [Deltaproteobacteria bacterium RIFCSPLOWO2_12_FULL_50_11]